MAHRCPCVTQQLASHSALGKARAGFLTPCQSFIVPSRECEGFTTKALWF